MCCRTRCVPYDPQITEAILRVGQFEGDNRSGWYRRVPEEEASVLVHCNEDGVIFSLAPAVSSMGGHEHKRIAASIMYEMAARYAEKVNGIVTQEGINVTECRHEGLSVRTLAVYPESRLAFELLCQGFRSVFTGDVD